MHGAIHQASKGDFKVRDLIDKADTYFSQQKEKVRSYQSLALLDGLIPPMLQYKDSMVGKIETALEPPKPVEPPKPPVINGGTVPPAPKKIIRPYNRSIIFPAKRLETTEDVDTYVEQMRKQLMKLLENCDGIQLK